MSEGRQRIALFCSILLCSLLTLTTLNYQLSLNSAASKLEQELAKALPEKIIGAGINDSHHEILNDFLVSRINQDLASIPIKGRFTSIQYCQAQVQSLYGKSYNSPDSAMRTITLRWSVNEHPHSMSLALHCQANWPSLLFSQFILALFSAAMLTTISKPLQTANKHLVSVLIANGRSRSDAMSLIAVTNHSSPEQIQALNIVVENTPQHTATLLTCLKDGGLKNISADQLTWFNHALQTYPEQLDEAIRICLAPPTLSLYPATGRVVIHGIEIKLPATPFFYYFWYARRRQKNIDNSDGWFINPPSNRADRNVDSELIALMQQYGGHYKAINDLEEKGLRAKTLDQNRSKIKDELIQVLGETLAAPYLFDMERDPQTARFKYRLATHPADIAFFEHKHISAPKVFEKLQP